MNKLVSRNPIQRFQQGKKIVKAENGSILDHLIGVISSQPNPLTPAYIMYKGYKKAKNDFEKIKNERKNQQSIKIDNNNRRLSNNYDQTYGKLEKVGANKSSNVKSQERKNPTVFKSKQDFSKNFSDFGKSLTSEEKAYLDSKGVNFNDAASVQQFMFNNGVDIGKYGENKNGVDGRWGNRSIEGWNKFRKTMIPSNFSVSEYEKPSFQNPVTNNPPIAPVAPPKPNFGYRTDFDYTGSNSTIRKFKFNNYQGLQNFVRANSNNQFAKDLTQRFGSVDKWNQNNVEKALGVSGTYRRGAGGDYSDIMRSMAEWAGTQNGLYDRKKAIYDIAVPFFKGEPIIKNNRQMPSLYNPQLEANLKRWLAYKKGGLISKNPIERFKNGSSFGRAFREARAQGLKEFIWNGNRYTTQTKEEKEKQNNSNIRDLYAKVEQEFNKKYKYEYNPYNQVTTYTNRKTGNKYLTSKTGRRADIIRT